MAKFSMELPTEIPADFEKIYGKTEQIFGDMTKAGAEVVAGNVRAGVPFPEMAQHVKLTRTYRTPSDGGINTKVYISGYIPFKGNRRTFVRRNREGGKLYVSTNGVPLDFLANIFEYGRSTSPFPKRPFFRKAFNKGGIEQAMLEAQKKASGGLLE